LILNISISEITIQSINIPVRSIIFTNREI